MADVSMMSTPSQHVADLLESVVALTTDIESSEVLSRIVRSACVLTGAQRGVLALGEPGGVSFVSDGLSEVECGQLIADAAENEALTAPIMVRGKVFGTFYVGRADTSAVFDADSADVLTALAAATGMAIEKARLQGRNRARRRWSEAVSSMSRGLLQGESQQSALELLVKEAADVSGAGMSVVALVEEGDGPLVIQAVIGPDPWGAAEIQGSLLGSSHWVEVLASRSPLLLVSRSGEAQADPPAGELRRGAGLGPHGATAVIPIGVGDTAYGLLVVGWEEGQDSLAAESIEPLAVYAEQAALTLAAASSQRDRARTSILEDRDRIARDMHDLVIQRLYASGLHLQGTSRLVDGQVRDRLEAVADELDMAIKEIRSTIFELHRLSDAGAVRAEIEEVVAGFRPAMGFSPRVEVDGDLDGLALTLQRDVVAVVREALANVVRHAQARAVKARIIVGDQVQIEIIDDGVGVSPDVLRRSGLGNMAERAARRAGTLTVSSPKGGGTTLRWVVPLEPATS